MTQHHAGSGSVLAVRNEAAYVQPEPSGELAPVSMQPADTTAEFMSRTGVRVISGALRAASAISPRLGGRIAYEILSRPPRFRPRPRERSTYADAKHGRIDSAGRSIKVYEWGCGPSILLVHCWGGRATQLHALIDTLVASGYRVISFDGPAHGESEGRRTDMFGFAQAVADVAAWAGPLDSVVAHSFGAATTMIAQRHYGLVAERYVLISMFTSCEWFLDAFGQFFSVRSEVIQHMVRGFDRRRGQRVDWSELCMLRILGAVRDPVLLVHDRSDREIPFSHAEQLLQAAASAELHATDGLGHRRILRDPEAVARIRSFIDTARAGS